MFSRIVPRQCCQGASLRHMWMTRSRTATNTTGRWASTLVVSEPLTEEGATPPATQSAVHAAASVSPSNDISLLVVGEHPPKQVPVGVSKIYHVPIADRLAETVASAIEATAATAGDCNVVVGTSTKFGSTVIPRAAALLDVSPITDILEIQDESKYFFFVMQTNYVSVVRPRHLGFSLILILLWICLPLKNILMP